MGSRGLRGGFLGWENDNDDDDGGGGGGDARGLLRAETWRRVLGVGLEEGLRDWWVDLKMER